MELPVLELAGVRVHMAVDLKNVGIDAAAISTWMGTLPSQRMLRMMAAESGRFKHRDGAVDPTEFPGCATSALHNDQHIMDLSGHTQIGADLAPKYRITDLDGKYPPFARDLRQRAL